MPNFYFAHSDIGCCHIMQVCKQREVKNDGLWCWCWSRRHVYKCGNYIGAIYTACYHYSLCTHLVKRKKGLTLLLLLHNWTNLYWIARLYQICYSITRMIEREYDFEEMDNRAALLCLRCSYPAGAVVKS